MPETYLFVMTMFMIAFCSNKANSRKSSSRISALVEFGLGFVFTLIAMASIMVARALLMYDPMTVSQTLIVGSLVAFGVGILITKISERL